MSTQLTNGWYPDPNDESSEIYWDGKRWHGRRDVLSDTPQVAEPPAPPVVVSGLSNLPTRKFWIGAIALISLALVTIFWIIPKINESNEKMRQGYEMMHKQCLDEKRSAGMDVFKSAEECKHWIE
jgi:hypothetical protein